VHWEWFDWNGKALAISEWPTRREELTFSPHGELLEYVSHFGDGKTQQTIFLYDEAGRLRETKWRNPDGSEGRSTCEYDNHGQRIDSLVKVLYSFENGRKVKTEVFNSSSESTAGVATAFNFKDGFQTLNSPSWIIPNAAVVSTFYDERDRPTEMDFYDKEHLQLSKIVRIYDERGRVKREEQQILSPRQFAGAQGTNGEEMPEEIRNVFAQAFGGGGHPMRMSYKYDDQDRVIEHTQEMGLFGYERTVSEYNEHGDLKRQFDYSTHQGDLAVNDEGNVVAPPSAPEKLMSQMQVSYEYDSHGNWTRKSVLSWSGEVSWMSTEKRLIAYY
jgi:hypothetical protein